MLKFHCTLDQLLTAAKEHLDVQNPVIEDEGDARGLVRELLETFSDKAVWVDCDLKESGDTSKVTFIVGLSPISPVHESDTKFPTPSGDEFREIVKQLQALIFPKSQR